MHQNLRYHKCGRSDLNWLYPCLLLFQSSCCAAHSYWSACICGSNFTEIGALLCEQLFVDASKLYTPAMAFVLIYSVDVGKHCTAQY